MMEISNASKSNAGVNVNDTFNIISLKDAEPDAVIGFYDKFGDASQKSIRSKLTTSTGHYKCNGAVALSTAGEIVGVYLGIPQRLLANPTLKAAQSVDTLIAPSCRGSGLIKKLAEFHFAILEEAGIECIFGVPNKLFEQITYKRLGWNMSRQTYRYIVFLPSPLLWLLHLSVLKADRSNVSDNSEDRGMQPPKLTEAEKDLLNMKAGYEIVTGFGCLAVIKRNRYKTQIGMIRCNRKCSGLDRFKFLALLAAQSPVSLLLSYATSESPTAQFLKPFSIYQKSLHFSGRLLGVRRGASFGEQYLEYLEYDTF